MMRTRTRDGMRCVAVLACAAAIVLTACSGSSAPPGHPVVNANTAHVDDRWCDHIPRASNAALRNIDAGTPWFDVYQVDSNVYAFVEAKQFQEAISYLVIGRTSALLWDSGIGLVPLRPVVERLTHLPVRVMNSHTHFDHVGGNAEFDAVLGMDMAYTRRNEAGGAHDGLAGEVAPESFCGTPPVGADTAAFQTRAWKVTRRVHDGDTVDLGGRVLEILSTPGHTPDAAVLLDRAHGLLFTGDSYYPGTLWLFVPETDLDAYQRSMDRIVALVPSLTRLLPAHNTASEPPGRLAAVAAAVRSMRAGGGTRTTLEGTRVLVTSGDIEIMTSTAVLAGRRGGDTTGGSGLAPPK